MPYERNAVFLFNDGQGNFIEDPLTTIQSSGFQTQNFSFYPNPFTYNVNFKIEINKKTSIFLNIYDLQGNMVYESTKKYEKGGPQNITWNGKNMINSQVGPGTYIVVVYLDGTLYKSVKLIKHYQNL